MNDNFSTNDIFCILEIVAIIGLILGVLFTALFYEFFKNKSTKK